MVSDTTRWYPLVVPLRLTCAACPSPRICAIARATEGFSATFNTRIVEEPRERHQAVDHKVGGSLDTADWSLAPLPALCRRDWLCAVLSRHHSPVLQFFCHATNRAEEAQNSTESHTQPHTQSS